MAKRTPKSPAAGKNKDKVDSVFDFDLRGWLGRSTSGAPKAAAGVHGRVVVVGQKGSTADALKELRLQLPGWQTERLARKRGELQFIATADGPLWLVQLDAKSAAAGHGGAFVVSEYGVARDLTAQAAAASADHVMSELHVLFSGASDDEQRGALVGLELGGYRYRQIRQPRQNQELPRLRISGASDTAVESSRILAVSINFARHLVNVPAADLNPTTYSEALQRLFAGSTTTKVDVWRGAKLASERMGLLIGVGQGAEHGPALVHLRYRPKSAKKGQKPLAFVGKGITFDTGGLDIKISSGMRLMKKDMGGSASLAGFAYWLEQTQCPVPCDIYLALAENAVDKQSFHPGDVLTARNGLTVEIDNTDAEGRLVLADALDVAVKATGVDQPSLVINLATLTGAMRVALGTRIAGLFANDDRLADSLLTAAQRAADPAWRMPLYADYLASLKTSVADMANSGHSRFGGSIVAALFLQKFVGQLPWAHFDMYAWSDGNTGGCIEAGGTGQCLQLLVEFVHHQIKA